MQKECGNIGDLDEQYIKTLAIDAAIFILSVVISLCIVFYIVFSSDFLWLNNTMIIVIGWPFYSFFAYTFLRIPFRLRDMDGESVMFELRFDILKYCLSGKLTQRQKNINAKSRVNIDYNNHISAFWWNMVVGVLILAGCYVCQKDGGFWFFAVIFGFILLRYILIDTPIIRDFISNGKFIKSIIPKLTSEKEQIRINRDKLMQYKNSLIVDAGDYPSLNKGVENVERYMPYTVEQKKRNNYYYKRKRYY